MKAIETKWKGYRFRSRTEARWAVFLEKLGIHFDYEVEGLVLPSGPYLPDFRLNNFPFRLQEGMEPERVWLEVKGDEPTEREITRCRELARYAGCPVILVIGPPDFYPQAMLFDYPVEELVEELMPHLIGWLAFIDVGDGRDAAIALGRPARPEEDVADEVSALEHAEQFEQAWEMFGGPFARILGVQHARFVGQDVAFRLSDRLKAAYDAARSARFEFGQTDPRWPA